MSIIEQAARRLEELRRSGIEVPQHGQKSFEKIAPPTGSDGVVARAHRRAEESFAAGSTPMTPGAAGRLRPVAEPDADGRAGTSKSKQVTIDLARLGAMGYLTPDMPRSQIADEFRVIKRPILLNLEGKSTQPIENPNLVMVTSSLAAEGKTFVAVNLAISMAMEYDKSVLLVDSDVLRPSVLNRLGLPPTPGLLDVLADPSVHLPDVLLKTNIDKLTILPAGAARGRATEMLASDAMNRLLAEIAERYSDRIIIFDAPPLLPSPESRVLATRMCQVILVVEAQRTPQRTVTKAFSTIESCPTVMTLLNKISESEIGFYYGYYAPAAR